MTTRSRWKFRMCTTTNDLTLYSFSSLYIFVTLGWPTVAETCRQPNKTDTKTVVFWRTYPYLILSLSVAFVIQHATRICRIIFLSLACLALPIFSSLSHKGTIFGKSRVLSGLCDGLIPLPEEPYRVVCVRVCVWCVCVCVCVWCVCVVCACACVRVCVWYQNPNNKAA